MDSPFTFACRGVVRQCKVAEVEGQAAPSFAYLTLLVGGMLNRQFLVPVAWSKRLSVGQVVEVSGAVVQATFKGQVSERFDCLAYRELSIDEPVNASVGAPAQAKALAGAGAKS